MRFSNFLHLKKELNYNGHSSSSFKNNLQVLHIPKKENNLLRKLSDIPKTQVNLKKKKSKLSRFDSF